MYVLYVYFKGRFEGHHDFEWSLLSIYQTKDFPGRVPLNQFCECVVCIAYDI